MSARKTTKAPRAGAAGHVFWGKLLQDRIGFKPSKTYKLRSLAPTVQVYLGDEDLEEHPETPSKKELDAYARDFQALLADEASFVATVRAAAFARYLKLYARYYEDAKKGKPLGITDADTHAEHLGEKVRIRVHKGDVVVSFWYELDREHGLELRFKGRKLVKIGGFGAT